MTMMKGTRCTCGNRIVEFDGAGLIRMRIDGPLEFDGVAAHAHCHWCKRPVRIPVRLDPAMHAGEETPVRPPLPLTAPLTARENEVLALIVRGLLNAEIATALAIGEAAVRTHVGHILDKTGLVLRTLAVALPSTT